MCMSTHYCFTHQIVDHIKLVVSFVLGVDLLVIFLPHVIAKSDIISERPFTI